MTRINTNVSSLNAQKSLARSNASLQQALTRLSTGLRINVGKDDPAGLIASEVLRADITSVQQAIANTERANQVIATADSALGQVSSLLNDIRGLVVEAANHGAMSDEQIAANQLQIDSSLDAINRIAQTTTFQGRKLLDGSLDFVTSTTSGGNFGNIADLQIDQANLGATGKIDVEISITKAAQTAQITNSDTAYARANAQLTFGSSSQYQADGGSGTAILELYSLDGKSYDVEFDVQGTNAAATTVAWKDTDTILVTVKDADASAGVAAIATAINANGTMNTKVYANRGGTADSQVTNTNDHGETTAAMAKQTLDIQVAAGYEGPAFNNMTITINEVAAQAAGAVTATWTDLGDRSTLVINVGENVLETLEDIEDAIENATGLTAGTLEATVGSVPGASTSIYTARATDTTDIEETTGYTGGSGIGKKLVMQISGFLGTEIFNFEANTAVATIVDAINLVSDATGVVASLSTESGSEDALVLNSTGYGSKHFVEVEVIEEGSGGGFEAGLSATRAKGTDIVAAVNGVTASGDGNTLSINTATLDLTATITAGATDAITFTIEEGGALFQLGPDVVSNQQARIGIGSLSTAKLRGESGRLYELGTGQTAALATNATLAASIVDEVITKIASLRGKLGAFQKTTLDANLASLTDAMENLTAAESIIRDADFAAETAELTRSQILVQSGTSVLAIANSNPQNILALLR